MDRQTRGPILIRFRLALDELYCDRLDRVVLFGARGDARVDSDYDAAIFMKSLTDRWAELDKLAELWVRFIDETVTFFAAFPYPATAYQERSPLMCEIRKEGLSL